jgi:hypothetical protein
MLSKALEVGFVSIGAPLWGNMEGRSFLRAFERKKNISLFRGIFMRILKDKIGRAHV